MIAGSAPRLSMPHRDQDQPVMAAAGITGETPAAPIGSAHADFSCWAANS